MPYETAQSNDNDDDCNFQYSWPLSDRYSNEINRVYLWARCIVLLWDVRPQGCVYLRLVGAASNMTLFNRRMIDGTTGYEGRSYRPLLAATDGRLDGSCFRAISLTPADTGIVGNVDTLSLTAASSPPNVDSTPSLAASPANCCCCCCESGVIGASLTPENTTTTCQPHRLTTVMCRTDCQHAAQISTRLNATQLSGD